MARTIPIWFKGRIVHYSLVDDNDFPKVARYRWRLSRDKRHARRAGSHKGKYYEYRLHREILGLSPEDRREIIHIDGDGFNNQRSNLRMLSPPVGSGIRSKNPGGKKAGTRGAQGAKPKHPKKPSTGKVGYVGVKPKRGL